MRLSGRIALFCALALTTGALSAVEKKNVPYYDSTRPAITMGLAGRILTFQTLLKKSFKFEKPLVCENRRGAFFSQEASCMIDCSFGAGITCG